MVVCITTNPLSFIITEIMKWNVKSSVTILQWRKWINYYCYLRRPWALLSEFSTRLLGMHIFLNTFLPSLFWRINAFSWTQSFFFFSFLCGPSNHCMSLTDTPTRTRLISLLFLRISRKSNFSNIHISLSWQNLVPPSLNALHSLSVLFLCFLFSCLSLT